MGYRTLQFSRITLSDVNDLFKLARLTFIESFGQYNSKGNMDKYLGDNLTPEILTGEISDPSVEIYFATVDQSVIGYMTLHLTEDPDETTGRRGLKIERLYILKEFQNRGFGFELLNFAAERAMENKSDYLWLGVWDQNYGAIRFYERHGYVRTGSCVFVLGEDIQTDYIMKKYL